MILRVRQIHRVDVRILWTCSRATIGEQSKADDNKDLLNIETHLSNYFYGLWMPCVH